MITDKMIRQAKRFSKVYMWIHVPLKKKIITQEVFNSRERRCAKLWAQIFGMDPIIWNEVRRVEYRLRSQNCLVQR